jgi:uncharacterized membrane protein YhhN
MKNKNAVIISLILLIVVSAVYRVLPRPAGLYGFAPQIAMAIFGGAIFRNDKKWAFALPLISMFIGDLLFQILYSNRLSQLYGFYPGQLQNYLLFAVLTVIGFLVKKINVLNVLLAAIASPTIYFLISNFLVWAGRQGPRGLGRPRTFNGLLLCYNDGLPFYPGSLIGTVFFSVVLFGGYYLLKKSSLQHQHA